MRNRRYAMIITLYVITLLVLAGVVAFSIRNQKNNSISDNNKENHDTTDNTNSSSNSSDNSSKDDDTSIKDSIQIDNNTSDEMTVISNDDTKDSPSNNNSNDDITDNTNSIDEQAAPTRDEPIVLAFAGDINLNEESRPIERYDRENKGILGCLSPELIEEMNDADIMMLNNEYAYSNRGKRIEEKSYTFRAKPERVNILHEMGVDIVSLANNHTLDYGMDALLDTFDTLEAAEIDYVGAGINMDRAKAPIYYTIGDKTIAYLAASRVIYAPDWYATDTRAGMIGTYDPALFLTSIKEADKNSDFIVVYVHWGIEKTHDIADHQKNLSKEYINAGADVVIGCHPHVMQGIDFYKGKLIAYSLGNYWFNNVKRETALLKIFLEQDGSVKAQLLPAMGKDSFTYLITDKDERKNYYRFMEDISFDVEFDEDGFISEKITD